MRLRELAGGLGNGFCTWFFDGEMEDWAKVAAVIGNALSHGFPTRHGIEHGTGPLVGVFKVTQAVIRLRVLVEAGIEKG